MQMTIIRTEIQFHATSIIVLTVKFGTTAEFSNSIDINVLVDILEVIDLLWQHGNTVNNLGVDISCRC